VRELDHAEENTVVYFDAWEPYLEPAGNTDGGAR